MKRKNKMKNGFSLLTVLLLSMGLSATAFAADSSAAFTDGKLMVYEPGSVYTDTDLFDGFKGVMPGDVRTEEITVENRTNDCDYIKVYLRAVPHDETNNPVSENVQDELQADQRRGDASEVSYMNDFLSQLSMEVFQGSTRIYEESPENPDGLADNVYLGSLRKGESLTLDVKLTVPIEMGNEYSSRIGEVDWVFVVEGHNDPSPDPGHHPSEDDDEDDDDTVVPTVTKPQTPAAPIQIPPAQPQTDVQASPQTGDSANLILWVCAAAAGAFVLIAVIVRRKKRRM